MSEKERMVLNRDVIEIISLVSKVFDEDFTKVFLWLRTDNLNFGGIAPVTLINSGRSEKVLRFIKAAR